MAQYLIYALFGLSAMLAGFVLVETGLDWFAARRRVKQQLREIKDI